MGFSIGNASNQLGKSVLLGLKERLLTTAAWGCLMPCMLSATHMIAHFFVSLHTICLHLPEVRQTLG